MSTQKNSGFALVDLVATCVAGLVICSLAIPAVNSSRLDSQVVECANNLRQLAIAAHNYHDAYKLFPSSTLGVKGAAKVDQWNEKKESEDYWSAQQNTSFSGLLAPFMSISKVMNKVDPCVGSRQKNLATFVMGDGKTRVYPSFEDYLVKGGLKQAAIQNIDNFQCPADDLKNEKASKIVIATQPLYFEKISKASNDDLGIKLSSDVEIDWTPGLTNYMANGGVSGGLSAINSPHPVASRYSGPMMSRTKQRIMSIPDGTSNTIMMGETVGGIANGKRTHVHSWLLGGQARGRGDIPFNKAVHPDNPNRKLLGDKTWSSVFGFGSKHKSGVTFARCDGSSVHLSRDIDQKTFYALLGTRDGRPVSKMTDLLGTMRQEAKDKKAMVQAEKYKDNAVVKALKSDPDLDDKVKSKIILEYIKRIESFPEMRELRKNNKVVQAIQSDPNLTMEEKFRLDKGYMRALMESKKKADSKNEKPKSGDGKKMILD